MKPLMLPGRRHRDRRGAAATERLRYALATPTGSRAGWREGSEKRRALARLLARRRRVPAWLASLVLVLAVGTVAAVSWQHVAESRALVPFEAEAYGALAARVRALCEAGRACSYGPRDRVRPPREVQRRMVATHARSVWHDPRTARTTVSGAFRAPVAYVHHAPPTDAQAALRAVDAARLAAYHRASGSEPPATRDLGGGWTEVATGR